MRKKNISKTKYEDAIDLQALINSDTKLRNGLVHSRELIDLMHAKKSFQFFEHPVLTILKDIHLNKIEFEIVLRKEAAHIEGLVNQDVPQPEPARPSEYATRLLAIAAPPNMRDALIGDSLEQFYRNVERFGPRCAQAIFWRDCLGSIASLAYRLLKKPFVAAVIYFGFDKLAN